MGKIKVMVKVACIWLVILMLCNESYLSKEVYADISMKRNYTEPKKYVGTSELNEIDRLISDRNKAMIEKNEVDYNNFDIELKSEGVKEVSLEEIKWLTNSSDKFIHIASGNDLLSINSLSGISSVSDVKFERIYTTYTYKKKKYDVMKIYATPISSGRLYQANVTGVKKQNSNTAKAAAMSAIKTSAASIAGIASKKVSIVQSVYQIANDVGMAISKTDTIKNITASYTWNEAESCCFIYIFNNNIGSYVLAARYNNVNYSVGVSVPTLAVKGMNAQTSIKQKSYTRKIEPVNCNSTSKALEYYVKGGVYTSQVTSFNIKGIEGKKVKTVTLSTPQNPMEAGY